jgi:hypothetical protein
LNNIADGLLCHTKTQTQGILGDTYLNGIPDVSNIFGKELREVVFLPALVSSLLNTILIVVFFSSKEEMFGFYAARGVACMKNTKPILDRAVNEFPTDPMNQKSASLSSLAP